MQLPAIVREHPVGTGVAVFAVGLLLLYLLAGSRKSAAPQGDGGMTAYYGAAASTAASQNALSAAQAGYAAQTAQTGLIERGLTARSQITNQGLVDIYALGDRTQQQANLLHYQSGIYHDLISADLARATAFAPYGIFVQNSLLPSQSIFPAGDISPIAIPTIATPQLGNM